MTNIWEKVAKKWRHQKPSIDNNKIEKIMDTNYSVVRETISKYEGVPSILDEIYSDDDDEDFDW